MTTSVTRGLWAAGFGAVVLAWVGATSGGGGAAAAPSSTAEPGAPAAYAATPWAVIAQRVDRELPEGDVTWVAADVAVPGASEPVGLDDGRDLLVVRSGLLATVDDERQPLVRLGPGEAAFVDDGDDAVSLVDSGAAAIEVAVRPVGDPGDGAVATGDPFPLDGAARDVETRSATVLPDATVDVEVSEHPVLLITLDGELRVNGEEATSDGGRQRGTTATTVAPAVGGIPGAQVVTATTTFVNHGDGPVTVLAVVVGEPVEVAVPEREPAPPTPETTVADTEGGDEEASSDADGDGLNSITEFENGTDPNNEDTDGDLITDGDEVLVYGTNPLSADSDEDGVDDYAEIDQGLSPLDADTDGDFLFDGEEYSTYGTDPGNWDTDGDGVWDGNEVAAGTDPLDPTSF